MPAETRAAKKAVDTGRLYPDLSAEMSVSAARVQSPRSPVSRRSAEKKDEKLSKRVSRYPNKKEDERPLTDEEQVENEEIEEEIVLESDPPKKVKLTKGTKGKEGRGTHYFFTLNITKILAVTLVSFFLIICFVLKVSEQKPVEIKPPWTTFEEEFIKLRSKYKAFTPELGWKVVTVAARSVLSRSNNVNDDENVPSVILVIGSKANTEVVKCFANDLNKIVANAYNTEVGNVVEASGLGANNVQMHFENNFVKEKKRSILLNGIEELPAPMSLHRYTDHNQAVHTDVIILLTAYRNEEVPLELNVTSRTMDSVATALLEKSWENSLDEANIAALLSRITPSVVVLSDKNKNKTTFTC